MTDFQAPTEACNPSEENPALQNIKNLYFFQCWESEFIEPGFGYGFLSSISSASGSGSGSKVLMTKN
jgi:hypothetical protein